MAANVEVATLPAKGVWAGRTVSWLPAGFLLVDGVPKLFKPAPVIEGTVKLGYSESVIIPLGIVLIACTVLYLIPRTAVLGAFLLTAYLGGAVATHVRVNESWFNVFFAVTFAFASKVLHQQHRRR
jgi:hypothetical protein